MNSNDRPDDPLEGVESNRSDNNGDNGATMNETTLSIPGERAPGAATSAVTRDAARLRSVMSDLRREAPVASVEPRTEEALPLPAYLETVMPAPRPQATELRAPAPIARPKTVPGSEPAAIDERSRATRLRSVASLVEMRLADEQRTTRSSSMPMPEQGTPRESEPRAIRQGAVRHLDVPIYEPEPAGIDYSTGGDSRVRVLIALAGTVAAGLVIGVGLYAGGGDLVSALFASEPAVQVDPNPAAITERPVVELPPATASDTQASDEPTVALQQEERSLIAGQPTTTPAAETSAVEPPLVLEDRLPTAVAERPRPEPVVADVVTGTPKPEPRAETRSERRSTPRAAETAAAESAPPARTSTKSITVQVGATPDQAEANRIAKRLKGKGAKNVEVVKSEKNGVPFYRVRFRSQGTAKEAQAEAGRAGFDNAWVVRN